jgi:hypothetical protein
MSDFDYGKMCCESAMKWYGWGSPVGMAIFFLGLGIGAVLIRLAIVGFS